MQVGVLRRVAALAAILMYTGATGGAETSAERADGSAEALNGENAFDFLMGEWKVHHRRLQHWLKGSDDWVEFDGTLAARKIWNGRGHTDEFRAVAPHGPVDGMSVRLYDPNTKHWRDYYASASRRILDPPLVGTASGERIEFYGHEIFDGKSIYVRQTWSSLSTNACRWEQAFSADGGRTWETNWVMDLSR